MFLLRLHKLLRLHQQLFRSSLGRVAGVLLDEDTGLTVFRGIPYAAPPIGELRWKPPQAVPGWEGIRECHEFGARCVQGKKPADSDKQSEDCLFLNVWTTHAGEDAKRPVMVWIHGGGFSSGGGDGWITNGSKFAQGGVVLVTMNYRLGPLGFLAHSQLSAESEHGVSGNYGFLDQIEALKWVKQNIAAFGGDANNVTIFGESAGGTSVSVPVLFAFGERTVPSRDPAEPLDVGSDQQIN